MKNPWNKCYRQILKIMLAIEDGCSEVMCYTHVICAKMPRAANQDIAFCEL